MAKTKVICDQCGEYFLKENGALKRARKVNNGIFCGRRCSGISRRKYKTKDQKKEQKREYDKQYRIKNKNKLKEKKAEYFKKTYNPEKAKEERKKRAKEHAEYCRRPEYKKWKKEYDRKYRAKKHYGDYWECFLLTMDIREECLNRQSDYQIRIDNETFNKAQRRKRNVRSEINSNKS